MIVPAKQQGMTLLGFIFVLAFLLAIVYLGIKVVPHYLNYYSVVDAMQKVALEPGIGRQSTQTIRGKLSNVLYVNYVDGLGPENLRVERSGAGRQVVLDYKIEEPLVANFSACMHFQKVVILR